VEPTFFLRGIPALSGVLLREQSDSHRPGYLRDSEELPVALACSAIENHLGWRCAGIMMAAVSKALPSSPNAYPLALGDERLFAASMLRSG